MNYPTVMQNPLLKKKETHTKGEAKQQVKFDNMTRPISGYQLTDSFRRPFSTKDGGETLMHKRKQLQFQISQQEGDRNRNNTQQDTKSSDQPAELPKGDRGLPHIQSVDHLSNSSQFFIGRSIQSGYHKHRLEGT